ncbi:MAG: hypothetical protein K0R41_1240 [Geminicoccaceae bacterium]|nr:hypothetical protein [Geminicoccaceae bacterium]
MRAGRRRGARLGLLGAGALWLCACAGDPRANPAWTLGGEPGLLFVIKQYYERNALEEGGICASPLLEGVTRSRVVEEDDRLLQQLPPVALRGDAGVPGLRLAKLRGGPARRRVPGARDERRSQGPRVAAQVPGLVAPRDFSALSGPGR